MRPMIPKGRGRFHFTADLDGPSDIFDASDPLQHVVLGRRGDLRAPDCKILQVVFT